MEESKDTSTPPSRDEEEMKEEFKEEIKEVGIRDGLELGTGIFEERRRNAGKGCIIGAFVGDAAGAYLEFSKSLLSPEIVHKAISLPGGGTHSLGPGQVTDDSELAMCLAHGLSEGNGELNMSNIVEYYGKWIASHPFDMGNTIRGAFMCAKGGFYKVRRMAHRRNQGSLSNGGLMRSTPLAVWLMNLENVDIDLPLAVKEDIMLSHPNVIAREAEICYCLAIYYLINNPSNPKRRKLAYKYAKNWASKHGSKEINTWFKWASSKETMDAHTKMGWVKIGWTYAFKHLYFGDDYKTSIAKVIARGGDSDTNAAIVGGLVGAAVGFDNIPSEMSEKMLNWYPTKEQKCNTTMRRPDFLNPSKNLLELIDRIFLIAPKKLKIVNGSAEDPSYDVVQ